MTAKILPLFKDAPSSTREDMLNGSLFPESDLPHITRQEIKARLASKIHEALDKRSESETTAAEQLHITPSEMAHLTQGDLEDFTVERLLTLYHNPYIRLWDADKKQTYYQHRAVAEQKLGRPLKPGEVVHHENGDKTDNRPENIAVFSSQNAHMLYENYQLREQAGIEHLFTIEELLATLGETIYR